MQTMYSSMRWLAQPLRKLKSQGRLVASIVTILTLGIGPSAAIFCIAYGVLLKPLSYDQPGKLVSLWPDRMVNKLAFREVAEKSTSFEFVTAYAAHRFPVTGKTDSFVVNGSLVGTDHFQLLREEPWLGRVFLPEESQPGKNQVLILSHRLWLQRYGGDREIVDSFLSIDGIPYVVVGVMKPDFRPLDASWEMWSPLPIDSSNEQDFLGSFYLKLVGRLRPEASPEIATSELRWTCQQLQVAYPNLILDEMVEAAKVVSLREYLSGQAAPVLAVLLGAVVFLFVIACANVANLLLVAARARRKETAIRSALGAAPSRLFREALGESLLLGLVGGATGLVAGAVAVKLILLRFPAILPRSPDIGFSGPVFLYTFLLAVAAAVLSGAWPAYRVFRTRLQGDLQAGEEKSGRRRGFASGYLLFAIQVMASTILLIAAGLILNSLTKLRAVDPGFTESGLLTLRLDPPSAIYREPESLVSYHQHVLDNVRALPGVTAAGAIHLLPLTSDNWSFPYMTEDLTLPSDGSQMALPTANFRVVTPGYFEALSIPVRSGEVFSIENTADSPAVGLINQTLADNLWPEEPAEGKTIQLFGSGGPTFTVIGVVGDVHQHSLDKRAEPEIYRPITQWSIGPMYLMVRSPLPAKSLWGQLRATISSIDPAVPISQTRPMKEVVAASMSDRLLTVSLVTIFAGLALSLSIAGIYSVLSYSVARRRREIGIRMALGARRSDIARTVVGRGLAVAGLALAVGLALGIVLSRYLASQLFEVTPSDPVTLVSVVLIVLATVVVSLWIPTHRATLVDPRTVM